MTRLEARKVIAIVIVSLRGKADLTAIDALLDMYEEKGYDVDLTLSEDGIYCDEVLQGDLSCLQDPFSGRYTTDDYLKFSKEAK